MMNSFSVVTSFSVAKIAARKTNRKMPPTQATIEVIDFLVGACPETWALSSVVITRAIAPNGCTTMSGAIASAASWQTIANTSIRVPSSHDGRVSSALIWSQLSPDAPSGTLSRSTFVRRGAGTAHRTT